MANVSSSTAVSTLANTAITVAATKTLAVNVFGSVTSVVNAGLTTVPVNGATLILSPGTAASAGANFTMADNAIGTFNLQQANTFFSTGLTIGGAGSATNAPVLTFDIGSLGTIDRFNVSKSVVVGASGGKITINPLAGTTSLTPGNYTFMTASSGLGVAGLTLTNSNYAVGGHTYTGSLANSTSTAEVLTIVQTSTLMNAFWNGDLNGIWNTFSAGNTNWSNSAATDIDAMVLPAFSTNVAFNVPGA